MQATQQLCNEFDHTSPHQQRYSFILNASTISSNPVPGKLDIISDYGSWHKLFILENDVAEVNINLADIQQLSSQNKSTLLDSHTLKYTSSSSSTLSLERATVEPKVAAKKSSPLFFSSSIFLSGGGLLVGLSLGFLPFMVIPGKQHREATRGLNNNLLEDLNAVASDLVVEDVVRKTLLHRRTTIAAVHMVDACCSPIVIAAQAVARRLSSHASGSRKKKKNERWTRDARGRLQREQQQQQQHDGVQQIGVGGESDDDESGGSGRQTGGVTPAAQVQSGSKE